MTAREFLLEVRPRIPESLRRLEEVADNLWYSWHRPTRALFASLDPDLWGRTGHNPKLFLRRVDQAKLDGAGADPVFLGKVNEALSAYDTYHGQTGPTGVSQHLTEDDLVAYFCAEYGLHESLHIYSGGLGILAGHHCKTASDLRLPFIGVGLLYRAGYFVQTIDEEGRQIASYQEADFDELPVHEARTKDGEALVIALEFPGRELLARVWEVRAGHVKVYLLDTDLEANTPQDRAITRQLYGGDRETRIQQELVLGAGGVRALRALDLAPTVWHLNEGHAAFIIVERLRELVAAGRSLPVALEAVAADTVFTTHTPVPAGHDHFPLAMVREYFAPLIEGAGLELDDLLALGLGGEGPAEFNMTTLAIRGSRHRNGVSRLHGEVSAEICRYCWPQIPPAENPIGHVTNGVHIPTVLAQEWLDLFDRTFGPEWTGRLTDRGYWQRVHDLPDHQFWSVKQSIKGKTLMVLRDALLVRYRRNQVSEAHAERLLRFLDPADPNVLTMVFARRFATYKRSTMLLRDRERLEALLTNEKRPVVVLYAGKAHPADEPGKALIREIHQLSEEPAFQGRILLLEGYDLALARMLVCGADVWLNNPVYTMEASGTSGMKAAVNGCLHLSVTDGWWEEGYEGDNGWAIKPSPHLDDADRRDREDTRTLYEVLEDLVVPLYYARGPHGYPPGWVAMAKRSMASVLPRFSMNRVLDEYAAGLYGPAAAAGRRLNGEDLAGAEQLAAWRQRVESGWDEVALRVLARPRGPIDAGESVAIEVAAGLASLGPEDVAVELDLERRNGAPGDGGETVAFEPVGRIEETGEHRYRVQLDSSRCGQFAYRIRMHPHHRLLSHPYEAGRMVWV